MALELVPYATLKAVLDLDKAALSDYPSLGALSTSVYAAFESYLGRWLEQDERTETVRVDGQIISLRAIPVTAVASVVDSLGNDITAWCAARSDSLKCSYRLCEEITVTYTGGLAELTDAENWLTRAALLQITHEWQRKEHIGATTQSNEGGTVTWPELGLLKEVKRLLDTNSNPARMGF